MRLLRQPLVCGSGPISSAAASYERLLYPSITSGHRKPRLRPCCALQSIVCMTSKSCAAVSRASQHVGHSAALGRRRTHELPLCFQLPLECSLTCWRARLNSRRLHGDLGMRPGYQEHAARVPTACSEGRTSAASVHLDVKTVQQAA